MARICTRLLPQLPLQGNHPSAAYAPDGHSNDNKLPALRTATANAAAPRVRAICTWNLQRNDAGFPPKMRGKDGVA